MFVVWHMRESSTHFEKNKRINKSNHLRTNDETDQVRSGKVRQGRHWLLCDVDLGREKTQYNI